MNKTMLQIEGLAILSFSVYMYFHHSFSWILFVLLLLAPDLSMIGYAFNKKAGAIVYNVFHTYVISIGIIVCGMILSNDTILAIGLIWTAHIGMDRMLGYGLKYETDFKDTHLQKV